MKGLVLAAVLALLLTAGCAPQRQPNSPTASIAPAPSTSWDTGDGPSTLVSVPPSAPAMETVLKFIHAWARPGLDQPVWFAGVRTLVTPEYASALATTTPANVPAHLVTGASVVRSSNTASLVADVPTDAGFIRVTALPVNGRWLVATAAGIDQR